jgi:hypothetical protein
MAQHWPRNITAHTIDMMRAACNDRTGNRNRNTSISDTHYGVQRVRMHVLRKLLSWRTLFA